MNKNTEKSQDPWREQENGFVGQNPSNLENSSKNVGHHLVDFDQVAEALCDVIGANLYVVSPEGEILGLAVNHEIENERMQKYLKDRQFPEEYATMLMGVEKTSPNVSVDDPLTAYPVEMKGHV